MTMPKLTKSQTVVLIDASSYLYRAYYAMRNLTSPTGEPTGAIYGFVNMVRSLREEIPFERGACVFDAKGKNFRHALFQDYKANRPPMPEDMRPQKEAIIEIMRLFGWKVISVEGVEADDVIGTLAKMAQKKGYDTIIATGDKDLAQLVDDKTWLFDTKNKESKFFDSDAVVEKFGVPPSMIIDLLALQGDKADNVPGIPGVGPKTAVTLLTTYGGLDGVIKEKDKIKGAVGKKFRENMDILSLSKELVTLNTESDVSTDLPNGIEDLVIGRIKHDKLVSMLEGYGIKAFTQHIVEDKQRLIESGAFGEDELEAMRQEALAKLKEAEELKKLDIFWANEEFADNHYSSGSDGSDVEDKGHAKSIKDGSPANSQDSLDFKPTQASTLLPPPSDEEKTLMEAGLVSPRDSIDNYAGMGLVRKLKAQTNDFKSMRTRFAWVVDEESLNSLCDKIESTGVVAISSSRDGYDGPEAAPNFLGFAFPDGMGAVVPFSERLFEDEMASHVALFDEAGKDGGGKASATTARPSLTLPLPWLRNGGANAPQSVDVESLFPSNQGLFGDDGDSASPSSSNASAKKSQDAKSAAADGTSPSNAKAAKDGGEQSDGPSTGKNAGDKTSNGGLLEGAKASSLGSNLLQDANEITSLAWLQIPGTKAWTRLKQLLESREIRKTGFALKETMHALANAGIVLGGPIDDVSIKSYVLDSDKPNAPVPASKRHIGKDMLMFWENATQLNPLARSFHDLWLQESGQDGTSATSKDGATQTGKNSNAARNSNEALDSSNDQGKASGQSTGGGSAQGKDGMAASSQDADAWEFDEVRFASLETPPASWGIKDLLCAEGVIALMLGGVLEYKMTPGQRNVFQLEMETARTLFGMERKGVLIDVEKLKSIGIDLQMESAEVEKRIYEIAGQEFNIASPAQVGEVLFEKLEISSKGLKKTAGGKISTNEENLEILARDYEIPKLILDYRKLQKLHGTYVAGLLPHVRKDGRIRTTYTQDVTLTGRLSSLKPNLQNIPSKTERGREIRDCFIAPEGSLLISADYSQIELRLMAHHSKDESLLDAFKRGEDVHKDTASNILGIPLESVDSSQRRVAKTINFGLIYGMSSYGLAKTLGTDQRTAQNFIDSYFAHYDGVRIFMDEMREVARANGFVETIMGRRVDVSDVMSSNTNVMNGALRTAINAPLQGSASDIIKLAMRDVDAWLHKEGLKARIVHQIHDELIIETPMEEVDVVMKEVPVIMSKVWPLRVPLVADIGKGENWNDAH